VLYPNYQKARTGKRLRLKQHFNLYFFVGGGSIPDSLRRYKSVHATFDAFPARLRSQLHALTLRSRADLMRVFPATTSAV